MTGALLALETSTANCSVALQVGSNVLDDTRIVNRRHNEELLLMISGLFERAGQKISDLDAVAFGCGPGSFTGVRIAAAVTQGIALAAGAQTIAVPTSMVMAANAFAADPELMCAGCSVHSRGELYYLSVYRRLSAGLSGGTSDTEAALMCVMGDVLTETAPVADAWNDIQVLAGPMPSWLPSSFSSGFRGAHMDLALSAVPLLAIARQQLAAGKGKPPEFALPKYVIGDHPWRPQVS